MPQVRISNLGAINTYINPSLRKDGDLYHAVNVDSYPVGAKSKRPGYDTFLGTANGSSVDSLFSWTKNDGDTMHLYRASGGILYHSVGGTGAWTISANGTVTAGNRIGYAVLDDTLIVCDGAGSTRHTTNGTSFTNTTLAPVAVDAAQFQNRVHLLGTSSTDFFSSAGDATDWSSTAPSDSSSITIPGEGKLSRGFVSSDRLTLTKNSGRMFRWDGDSLIDMSTDSGPSSPDAVGETEGYYIWLNRLGAFGYGGGRPELLSNPIQSQIYNNAGSAITGAAFGTAAAEIHRYDWYCAIGDTTDDVTEKTINNNIIKYNFQKNEFLNYKFAHPPTAWHSYTDKNGDLQLIFGDANGQCYKINGSSYSDAGEPIDVEMEMVVHLGDPFTPKTWKYASFIFNPSSRAKVSVAVENDYSTRNRSWTEIGPTDTGFIEHRFKQGSEGRLLFVKIFESSKGRPFSFHGMGFDYEVDRR